MFPTVSTRVTTTCTFRNRSVVRMADGGDEDDALSFDDATQSLKDEEDEERMGGSNNNDEENEAFDANKSSYDSMRAEIRARTSNLNMEKSVTTAEAIKAATNRAMAGEAASTPAVDLSKFNDALLDSNPEDELTDEQKAEIDKVGQLNLWEQAVAEYKYTRFPTASTSIKQAGLMLVIFAVTATVILKVDEALRFQYTDWGLIPRTGEVMDYSDLTLPEGFTDQMTEEDLSNL